MTSEIVPFGKYKGQSAEALLADQDYCQWLTAQPWFRERWPNVYNVVINYGAEPQDSPEHNQMQARFLDDGLCFVLADLLYPKLKDTYDVPAAIQLLEADRFYAKFRECVELKTSQAAIGNRRFEDHGWDVTYEIKSASITTHLTSLTPLPACTCKCDHDECGEDAKCHGGRGWCRHERHGERRGVDSVGHCGSECYWSSDELLAHDERRWLKEHEHWFGPWHGGKVRVELKPDLGDDYPSALRQVTGYPRAYGDQCCVIARRHQFEHVTWEQVRQIFAASSVTLLAENEVTP